MEMKRRKTIDENALVYNGKLVTITKEKNQELFFEIKDNVTTDLAEAVSIMMKLDVKEQDVWNIEIQSIKDINPEKALYWLSGGDVEWLTMEHYSTSWINCYSDFCEKYSKTIIEIVESSKSLGDIKDKFNRYLNLPTLYNFALSKGFVK